MVVEFSTTYVISAYHHWCYEFESRSRGGVQHYVIKFVNDLRHVGGFLNDLRHVGGFLNDLRQVGGFLNDLWHVGGFLNDLRQVGGFLNDLRQVGCFLNDLRQVGGFLNDLWHVGGFLLFTLPSNKNDSHDITEILLKVALNIIKQTNIHWIS
jgi:hypothetical protein